MKLIISPLDTMAKLELEVETYMTSGDVLFVVFPDGRCRQFPMMHLWYWEVIVPSGDNRTKPPKES